MMGLTPRGRRHRIRTAGQARRLRAGILAAITDEPGDFDPTDVLQLHAFVGARITTSSIWAEATA